MKRKIYHIGVPILFLFFYVLSGMFFLKTGMSGGVATCMANLIFILFGGEYYYLYLYRTYTTTYEKKKPNWQVILLSMVVILVATQTFVLWHNSHFVDAALSDYHDTQTQMSVWLLLGMSIIISPVLEEILIRGIMMEHFRQVMPLWTACILSALIFGILHGTFTHIVISMFVGVFFSLVYIKTSRLWICMLLHGLYNGCCLLPFFPMMLPYRSTFCMVILMLASIIVLVCFILPFNKTANLVEND